MFLKLKVSLNGSYFESLEDMQRNVTTVQKGVLENYFWLFLGVA